MVTANSSYGYKHFCCVLEYRVEMIFQTEKVISGCKHTCEIKCVDKPDKVICKKPCSLMLFCGHKCTNLCYEMCSSKCDEMVDCGDINPACGHKFQIPCHMKTDESESFLLTI